jgi:F-type H+-transporting ATPase subunit epsilon
MPIRCSIVSQDRLVYEGNADMVVLPGEAGEMGILPNHAPLLATLQYGILIVKNQSQEEAFTIAGGIAEVQPDLVTVLADAAENVEEIDVARAEAARKRAEASLQAKIPAHTDEYLAIEAALKRSNLRLDAVKRYQSKRSVRAREHREPGES